MYEEERGEERSGYPVFPYSLSLGDLCLFFFAVLFLYFEYVHTYSLIDGPRSQASSNGLNVLSSIGVFCILSVYQQGIVSPYLPCPLPSGSLYILFHQSQPIPSVAVAH